jgi:hypothetical protein
VSDGLQLTNVHGKLTRRGVVVPAGRCTGSRWSGAGSAAAG